MEPDPEQHQFPPDNPDDIYYRKLFVRNVSFGTTNESLRFHFAGYGAVEEAVVVIERNTGKSKGYGFVTFDSPQSAVEACKNVNPIIDGREAHVQMAHVGAKRAVTATHSNPGLQAKPSYNEVPPAPYQPYPMMMMPMPMQYAYPPTYMPPTMATAPTPYAPAPVQQQPHAAAYMPMPPQTYQAGPYPAPQVQWVYPPAAASQYPTPAQAPQTQQPVGTQEQQPSVPVSAPQAAPFPAPTTTTAPARSSQQHPEPGYIPAPQNIPSPYGQPLQSQPSSSAPSMSYPNHESSQQTQDQYNMDPSFLLTDLNNLSLAEEKNQSAHSRVSK